MTQNPNTKYAKASDNLPRVIYWLCICLTLFLAIQAGRYGINQVQIMTARNVFLAPNVVFLMWVAALQTAALISLTAVALAVRARAAIWLAGWLVVVNFGTALAAVSLYALPLVLLPLALLAGLAIYLIKHGQL